MIDALIKHVSVTFKCYEINCIIIDGVQDCNTEIVSPVLFYHCISYVDHMLLQILI
jgi:hypothetical protein